MSWPYLIGRESITRRCRLQRQVQRRRQHPRVEVDGALAAKYVWRAQHAVPLRIQKRRAGLEASHAVFVKADDDAAASHDDGPAVRPGSLDIQETAWRREGG